MITSAIDLPEIKTAIQTAQGIGNGKQELNAQQKKEVTDKIIELEKKERQNDKSGKPKITDLERIQLKILKDDQKAVDQGGTNKISVGDAAKIALDSVQAHNKNNSKQMTR